MYKYSHKNSTARWLLHHSYMQNIPNTDWAVQLPEGWIADVSRAFSVVDLFAVGRQHFREVFANVPTDSFVLRDAAAAKVVTITMSFGNALSVQVGGRQLQHISRRAGMNQTCQPNLGVSNIPAQKPVATTPSLPPTLAPSTASALL